MKLILQSEIRESVVIIRCRGRIVSGDEVGTLKLEVEKLRRLKKRVVLQLAEVSYIDSAGLGALVRLFGALRSDGGGLRLCQLSSSVRQVLQLTNLLGVIPTYGSEREAVEAFSEKSEPLETASRTTRARVVCLGSSNDSLEYLNAVLTRAGYEVFSTRHLSDAKALVLATAPRIVIYAPGTESSDSVIKMFHESDPNLQILLLPSDFSTAEASQAGTELLDRVRSALTNRS